MRESLTRKLILNKNVRLNVESETTSPTFRATIDFYSHRYPFIPMYWTKTDVTCLHRSVKAMINNTVLVDVS